MNTDEVRKQIIDKPLGNSSNWAWWDSKFGETLDEIDRLEEVNQKWHMLYQTGTIAWGVEQRTKGAMVQPVWTWICEVINTQGKTFQKDELEQAIDSVGKK